MARQDEKVKESILHRLKNDNRIDESDIDVEVDGGRVILKGTVPTVVSLSTIIKETWAVSGVTQVRDQLDIRKPAVQ